LLEICFETRNIFIFLEEFLKKFFISKKGIAYKGHNKK